MSPVTIFAKVSAAMGRGPAATARPSIAIRVSRETETPLAANGPPTFSERFVTTSRLGSLLASANEKLSDRGAMRLWTAGVLAVGVAIRFGWTFFHGFRVNPTEAFYEAAAFAARGEPADAYGPGTGPTAHLPPGMPSMVGMVYHLWNSWVCSRCESAAGRAWPGRPRLQRRCLSRFPTLGRSATRRCSARRFGREAISVSTLRSATTKKPSVHRTPARSFWIASPRSRRFSIPPPSPT